MKGWSISFNPLGALEPQAALGIGVGYRFSSRWQLWSETSLIAYPLYNSYPGLKGFREILALKYFYGRNRDFFIGAEVRWKRTSYRDKRLFINRAVHDTADLNYTLVNPVFGAALWAGKIIPLGGKHWLVETSIGVGFKYQSAIFKGVPPGYRNLYKLDDTGIPVGIKGSGLLPYLPGSIRLIYVL